MSKVILHIEDGAIQGAYSDDPTVEVVVYDFDWQVDPDSVDKMENELQEMFPKLNVVGFTSITPFDFMESNKDTDDDRPF